MKPIAYRVGWPGWKLAEKLGARPYYRVDVMRDSEAGVYVARSSDIPGLVVEAPTLDELVVEMDDAAQMLLDRCQDGPNHVTPDVRLHAPCAA